MRSFVTLCVLTATAAPALADGDADALTAQGEQLARDGEYTRAISAFKQADALAPSAKHACLIGLAYTRRELWSQAEIWLDRCKARAKPEDPLPDWFDAARGQLEKKLAGTDAASLEILVDPSDTPAVINVSSFPPDETFAPRIIHLVPGTYVVTGTVPGQEAARETVNVQLGQDNKVTLHFKPHPVAPPPHGPSAPVATRGRSSLPRYLLIGGGVAAVAGVGLHALAYHERSALQDAYDANDLAKYKVHQGTFEAERAAAISCYALAAVAIGVGVVLHARDEQAPTPVASILPGGGAIVGVEVRR